MHALVEPALFAAVAEQLAENQKRQRQSARGARYLLQGLVVCQRCGHAFYGKPVSRSSAKGKTRYAYYRCLGTDAYRFGGERTGRCEVAADVLYQVSSHLEVLPPEQFVHVHEELLADGLRKGLVSHFRPHNRLGLSPLGIVIVEALPRCLSVAAFHTFPDEFAIVKTQSLIEQV